MLLQKLEKIKEIVEKSHSEIYELKELVEERENLWEELYKNESIINLEKLEKYLNYALDEIEEFLSKNS